jgi:hypothetical protein
LSKWKILFGTPAGQTDSAGLPTLSTGGTAVYATSAATIVVVAITAESNEDFFMTLSFLCFATPGRKSVSDLRA